jgi:hypothetical protein
VDSVHTITAIRPVKIALRHTDRRTDTRKIIDKFRNRFAATLTIISPNYQRLLQGLIIYIRSGHYMTHYNCLASRDVQMKLSRSSSKHENVFVDVGHVALDVPV